MYRCQSESPWYTLGNIWTLDKKGPENSPSYPSFLLKCNLNRFPTCVLTLQHGALNPGKILLHTEGQKSAETGIADSWSVTLSKFKSGEMWKTNEQKPHLNRVGPPERGALPLCDNGTAQEEEEKLLFISGQDSANESHRLTVWCNPPDFLLPSIKQFSHPGWARTCTWPAMVAGPEFQFSVHPK